MKRPAASPRLLNRRGFFGAAAAAAAAAALLTRVLCPSQGIANRVIGRAEFSHKPFFRQTVFPSAATVSIHGDHAALSKHTPLFAATTARHKTPVRSPRRVHLQVAPAIKLSTLFVRHDQIARPGFQSRRPSHHRNGTVVSTGRTIEDVDTTHLD